MNTLQQLKALDTILEETNEKTPKQIAQMLNGGAKVWAGKWFDKRIRLLRINLLYKDDFDAHYEEIMQGLNALIKEYPDDPQLYYSRGVCSGRKGELKLAINSFTKAIEIDPFLPGLHIDRGMCYLKRHINAFGSEPIPKLAEPAMIVGATDRLETQGGVKVQPSLSDLYPDIFCAITDFTIAIHYGWRLYHPKFHKPYDAHKYRFMCHKIVRYETEMRLDFERWQHMERQG